MLNSTVSLVGATVIAITALGSSAGADSNHCARGYVTSRGTNITPHCQATPDNTMLDNDSSRDNINPYTGRPGTHRLF